MSESCDDSNDVVVFLFVHLGPRLVPCLYTLHILRNILRNIYICLCLFRSWSRVRFSFDHNKEPFSFFVFLSHQTHILISR